MKPGRLAAALGHAFRRETLLQQALTHRSHGAGHNERLEFLGDSVLNCVIASALYDRFADIDEGDLSRHRARLVRQETLAALARSLDLGGFLRLGEGELKSGGALRPSILADSLEAVIGAIFVDGGFDAARAVIDRLYAPMLSGLVSGESVKDPKTALQELLQGRRMALPRYELTATRGQPHDQEFEVECLVDALSVRCSGSGKSRRMAEQDAARKALEALR